MKQIIEIERRSNENFPPGELTQAACRIAGIQESDLSAIRVVKRSVDGRSRVPVMRLRLEVYAGETPVDVPPVSSSFRRVDDCPTVLIVGTGPAGYFAALECLELGLKPILFERGKDVRARRRDLRAIQQFGTVDPDSNYCFGEGGAGTYSDGKLWTKSKKRGEVDKVFRLLVEHGATPDILIETHPHIGSNKLHAVVQKIRESIEQWGGQVHFGHKVTDIIVSDGQVRGVVVNDTLEFTGDSILLATGHSSRDIFRLLHSKKIMVEPKPFALGVRVEHPQDFVDNRQYHSVPRNPLLPAASYKLVHQYGNHGVFSFCMCPGGIIVPASTAPGEIVVNGMSMSRRDSRYANSGIVVSVDVSDLAGAASSPLALLDFQASIEQAVFRSSDGSQRAPAQRVSDIVKNRASGSLPGTSYIPGLQPADLRSLFPMWLYSSLVEAFKSFNKKMPGFVSSEAVAVATESRTSSPVRIPRDEISLMHPQVQGLFPCGEGAGYAGGIVSAAMDGQNCARAIARYKRSITQ